MLWLDGEDVRERPLRERKRLLREALNFGDRVLRFTAHRSDHEGEALFARGVRARAGRALIAKRADSPYAAKRSKDWLKFKCVQARSS